ncbi:type II secretion system protein [Chromatiaceae bacterium AAb-1]|nr:type II secretion system protein [Chromatiaceae bacterium AAb-1]
MRKQSGFTFIELVIVVIILSILAITALPRFLNLTDQAENAAIEGIAGGFASAVTLVRAEWEVSGRPNNQAGQTTIQYDGIQIGVDGTTGYPTGSPVVPSTTAGNMTADSCLFLIENLFQNSVKASTVFAVQNTLYVRLANNQCYYHQTSGLTTAPADTSSSNGFSYHPVTGRVATFLLK